MGILGVRWKSEQNRIYIGRRFRNDTERLEELFERYTKEDGEGSGGEEGEIDEGEKSMSRMTATFGRRVSPLIASRETQPGPRLL